MEVLYRDRMNVRLILALFLFSQVALAQETWPFGGESGFAKRDLYNLGVLGIKASDEIKGEPKSAGTGRRQVSTEPFDPSRDVGPERLRVEILFPGGPAANAGVAVGDVIVAIGNKKFAKGCFAPIATTLMKALAKDGEQTISLKVERAEGGTKEKLDLIIQGLGKDAGKLSKSPAHALLAGPALAWLATKQEDSGGFPQTLSATNGAVVQTCVAGLAWIGGGSDLESGPHQENLKLARSFVTKNLPSMKSSAGSGDANWNQENWGWVHAAIFLGELHAHSPSDELLIDLQKVVDGIQGGREDSGGFGHGPGGPNALGYVEFNIVAGLALCGLGLAERAGCDVDQDALEAMRDYVEASSSGGGVGYSTKAGQVGQGNIGRSATAWLGYRLIGEGKSKAARSMAGFVKRHAGEVQFGHASLTQHIMWAGLAAQAQGGGAEKNFWSSLERDMILAMSPDGSFQPRPWHESLSMASNSDVTFGDVWTTAAWCSVLVASPETGDGLSALLAP